MYNEIVYRIGKRYSKEREQNPEIEYPYFSGHLSELVTHEVLQELSELEGEYIIAYNDGKGTQHQIRVYFDEGSFEAEGMAENQNSGFSLSGQIDL